MYSIKKMENNLEFYRKMGFNLSASAAATIGICDICGDEGELIEGDEGWYHRECLEGMEEDAALEEQVDHREDLNPENKSEDYNPENHEPGI
jgi:hypothetical protein